MFLECVMVHTNVQHFHIIFRNELLEIEDDENFISEIIDEITESALNQVFDKIIESRVQPHTVLAARELLLDVIEVSET